MIILPSLEIVPAKYNTSTNTLLSQIPIDGTGDFTVSRTTSPVTGQSTRVNALGQIELVADNVPRLDYPLGGAVNGCPALLVEPSATNVLSYSEEFDNAAWSKGNMTVLTGTTGVFTAPNGTTNADKIIATTTSGVAHSVQRSGLASAAYTFSVFAKAGEESVISLWLRGNTVRAEFNLVSGTISNITVTSARIENYGNGWYRCSVYDSTAGTTASVYGRGGGVYTGNGVDGFYLWGAQVEANSVPTSYIPTTTQAITRSNEIMTRTSASGLIGQSEGAIYWDIAAVGSVPTGTGNPELNIRNEAFTNWIGLTSNSSPNPFRITVQAVAGSLINYQASITSGKAAVAWSSAGAVLYVNGVQVATSATNPNFSFSRAEIRGSTMAFKANAFALYPTRLTDTQLALLTSPYTSYSSMASALSYTLG